MKIKILHCRQMQTSALFPMMYLSLMLAIHLTLTTQQTEAKDAPLVGVKPAHHRVTWTSDPAHEATVSWSTRQPAKKYFIRYRVKDSQDKEATLAAEREKFIGGETTLYSHHARMEELNPSTAYEFRIHSDHEISKPMYFVTGPADDRDFRILHGGDSRSDTAERRRCNEMMALLFSQSNSNADPNDNIIAMSHGGDYVANGKSLEQWTEWLSAHELTMASDGRLLPVIPTRGNHDTGKLFNQIFAFPDNDKNYYGIDLGSQVRLIVLNTEISTAGNQAKWLERELKTTRPKYRWVLAQYHRPAFPAVKAPGTALYSWVPLFEKYHIDMACESDGHVVKRTVPIRGNVEDKTGVVYIGEGGLGVGQRKPKVDRWYLKPPGMCTAASHIYVF